MKSRTHMAIGNAISLAVIRPTSIKYLALCTAETTIGSVISDIDVSTSESHKDLDKIILISLLVLLSCYFLEIYFNIGIINLIRKKTEIQNIIAGIILLIIICIYGFHKPHRTFMHSLLCLLLLTTIVSFMFKQVSIYFFIGMISHIFLDLFNKKKYNYYFLLRKK